LNQATLGLVLAEKNYSERKKIFEDSIKRLVEMKNSKLQISCKKH
jgi:hypothetical protein